VIFIFSLPIFREEKDALLEIAVDDADVFV